MYNNTIKDISCKIKYNIKKSIIFIFKKNIKRTKKHNLIQYKFYNVLK